MQIASFARLLVLAPACAALACGGNGTEETGSAESASVADADSMTRRSDGRFDVRCHDGHTEIATAEQIRADQVCQPQTGGSTGGIATTGPSDPLDERSCAGGSPWTLAAAEAAFPAGSNSLSRTGPISFRFVKRSCVARTTTAPSCTEWTTIPGSTRMASTTGRLTVSLDPNSRALSSSLDVRQRVSWTWSDGSNAGGEDFGIAFANADALSRTPARSLDGYRQYYQGSTYDSVAPASILLPANEVPFSRCYSCQAGPVRLRDLLPDAYAGIFTTRIVNQTTSCTRVLFDGVPHAASAASWTEYAGALVVTHSP